MNRNAIEMLGFALFIVGIGMVWLPAALMAAGVLAILAAQAPNDLTVFFGAVRSLRWPWSSPLRGRRNPKVASR